MSLNNRRTIIIAGAGVAGLTAALTLAKSGYRIVVLERSANVDQAGVGIQLSPNATNILAGLGLLQRLTAAAFVPESVIIRSARLGHILSVFPLGHPMTEKYGAPYLVLHRADLINLLLSSCRDHPDIDCVFGASFEDVAIYSRGVTVMAMRGGEMVEYTGCALIGADGVHSNVRSRIIGSPAAKPTGDTAWRALLPIERVATQISRTDTSLWIGDSGHVVCYPVRDGRQLNVVAITPQSYATDITRRTPDADPQSLKEFFKHWNGDVRQLIDSAENWQGWPLNEINPKDDWTRGPCVLIGDAAHAALPYAAQGGAAAIEDAAVLANTLAGADSDMTAATIKYETLRKPRSTKIWNLARTNRSIYHLGGISGQVRNAVLRVTGPDRLHKRYEWLYGWKL